MDFRAPAQLIYTDSAQWSIAMAFITDKEKLKSDLFLQAWRCGAPQLLLPHQSPEGLSL
jgi:hypothetical protein